MKLTQEQIEEIRKRAETATPGPWFRGENDKDIRNRDECVLDAAAYTEYGEAYAQLDASDEDIDFIINARQDIPKLLAHIEELEKASKEEPK